MKWPEADGDTGPALAPGTVGAFVDAGLAPGVTPGVKRALEHHPVLGREGIAYFAGGVIHGRLSQLHQRSDPDRHLHAIAFVVWQFARFQDNLIDTPLASVQAHLDTCQRERKELCHARRRERDRRLAGLLETVDRHVLRVLEEATAIR